MKRLVHQSKFKKLRNILNTDSAKGYIIRPSASYFTVTGWAINNRVREDGGTWLRIGGSQTFVLN